MATQSWTNRVANLARLTARNLKAAPSRLSVAAVALLIVVAPISAQNSEPCTKKTSYCLFITDYGNSQVQLWTDDGKTGHVAKFLTGYPQGGTAGAGEGVSCLSGSANVMYTASAASASIGVYDLTNGAYMAFAGAFGGGNIASLSTNSAGTVLYEAEYAAATILGLGPMIPPVSPWFTFLYTTAPFSANSHDAFLDPNGNVFATQVTGNNGIQVFDPALNFSKYFLNAGCTYFLDSGGNKVKACWDYLSGMAWDANGNLWVSSANAGNGTGGIFEFDPTGKPMNFTPDAGTPIGLAVAPATDPSNPNFIIAANVNGGDVSSIDPKSCKGSVATPAMCTLATFISAGAFQGRPKYPVYYSGCPNPDLNGHVEICKLSDPAHPVTGTFDFTATAPFFSSGDLKVPVGYCSGPVEVPAANPHGVVTVNETPVLGDLVSNVSAYSYDQYGFKIDELKSWTLPELHANVYVVPGDVNLETVATFTNYAAAPGQLKICKIAGKDVPIGTPFDFYVTPPGIWGFKVTIPAGPADQGGYCQLVLTGQVNTPILVSESSGSYQVSIVVDPADRGSNYAPNSVIVTLGDGITEASFTNSVQRAALFSDLGSPGNLYQCGNNSGWTVAGSGSLFGKSYTQANKFQVTSSSSVSEIDLGVPYVSGTNSFYVAIQGDSGGQPGPVLATFANLSGISCGSLVTITGIKGLSLTTGTNYWVVVGPMNLTSTTYERWSLNSTGVTGTELYSNDGGLTWNSLGQQTLGAFAIYH